MKPKYRQIYAVKKANAEKIKKLCPQADTAAGIYCIYRFDDTFKYAYIGKADNLVERLASHLSGYKQHIDVSIIKRKLYDEIKNPQGWQIKILCHCREIELDELETKYIFEYGNNGWQMPYNKNSGGTLGKQGINENKAPKNYTEGKVQGYTNAKKFVSKLFEKNLKYEINGDPNKNKEKALEKFKDFIETNENLVDND